MDIAPSASTPSGSETVRPSIWYPPQMPITGVPVAGVVPYVHVDIDDEDSLSERFTRDTVRKLIDIAVIRLPSPASRRRPL